MRNITKEELLGYCETREENDDKVSALKTQIKALNADSSDLTKETATDFETKPKHLNDVYRKYCEYKSGEAEDDDFYTMASLLSDSLSESDDDE